MSDTDESDDLKTTGIPSYTYTSSSTSGVVTCIMSSSVAVQDRALARIHGYELPPSSSATWCGPTCLQYQKGSLQKAPHKSCKLDRPLTRISPSSSAARHVYPGVLRFKSIGKVNPIGHLTRHCPHGVTPKQAPDKRFAPGGHRAIDVAALNTKVNGLQAPLRYPGTRIRSGRRLRYDRDPVGVDKRVGRIMCQP